MPPEVMLNRLRGRSGYWFDLAKLLPKLLAAGYDSSAVGDATGLEPKLQGIWGASLPVYESLKLNGFPEEKLAFFANDGEFLLFEIRFLTAQQRQDTAEYIVDNRLGQQECVVLARAVKEHDRRRAEREGFSNAPGDCMAYKYYRDAQEARRDTHKQRNVEQGLKVAVTEDAKRKLMELSEDKRTTMPFTSQRMSVLMLRLLKEECGFRPVAVAGALEGATAAAIQAVPVARQQGVFGTFVTNSGEGQQPWVALPAWTQVLVAKQPVALEIPDCSKVAQLLQGAAATSEGDIKRLATPGLLVIDRAVQQGDIDPGQYYLTTQADGTVAFTEGAVAADAGATLCARVLFCVRPPVRETSLDENDLGALQL